MSLPLRRAALALLLALGLGACAPGISVKRYRPSRLDLGPARSLALRGIRGPPEAIGVVGAELAGQIARAGYFQLSAPPAVPTGVEAAGRSQPQLETGSSGEQAALHVAVTVTRWDYSERTEERRRYRDGSAAFGLARVPQGGVSMLFQAFESATGELRAARDYHATLDGEAYFPEAGDPSPSQAALLRSACALAVDDFLDDVTPDAVTGRIALDDEEGLEEGIALCEQGRLDEAMAWFDRASRRDPKSSGAVYDLGVLFEARGDDPSAERHYARALVLEPKGLYREALERLRRRVGGGQRLEQPL